MKKSSYWIDAALFLAALVVHSFVSAKNNSELHAMAAGVATLVLLHVIYYAIARSKGWPPLVVENMINSIIAILP